MKTSDWARNDPFDTCFLAALRMLLGIVQQFPQVRFFGGLATGSCGGKRGPSSPTAPLRRWKIGLLILQKDLKSLFCTSGQYLLFCLFPASGTPICNSLPNIPESGAVVSHVIRCHREVGTKHDGLFLFTVLQSSVSPFFCSLCGSRREV